MAQKYRIYINQKVVLITESAPKHAAHFERIDDQTFDLKNFYQQVISDHQDKLFYILVDDAKSFLQTIIQNITLIKAAGGLVENHKGEYLFIYRNDKWDLPKGKIEKGEKIKEGAVREVEEECGINVDKLGKKICKTYHTYTVKGQVVLKKTYWYKMKHHGAEKLKPQIEEGITDVQWFKKKHIYSITKNTFPSIMDVLYKMDLVPEPHD